MAYDVAATTGLVPVEAPTLLGAHDGYTVLSVAQTQQVDAVGNLVDAFDVAIQVGARPGVFTYSTTAIGANVSALLDGAAGLAQTIEAIYAIGDGSPPGSQLAPPPPPIAATGPLPIAPTGPPPSPPSPQPPPRVFVPL